MSFKFSTGYRNGICVNGSVKALLDGGFIDLYAGAVPASPDDSVGAATLLCTISDNATGAGLTLNTTASGGVVTKLPAQTWKGEILADGTPTFFRFRKTGDTGGASTTDIRIQGTIGLSGADMVLNPAILDKDPAPQYQVLDYFSVAALTSV